MNRRAGATVVEIVVAAGLLGILFLFLYQVFVGGVARTGQQAQWAGNVVSQLRGLSQHLSVRAKNAGRPMTLLPAALHENDSEDFACRVWGQPSLSATEAVDIRGSARPGTVFLRFVEAEPERQGGSDARPAKIVYHLYSLTRSGKLLYQNFSETIGPTSPPDYIAALRRPMIPPPEAVPGRSEVLVDDVESVALERPAESRDSLGSATRKTGADVRWPLTLVVTCCRARGQTRRTERITFVPNVPVR